MTAKEDKKAMRAWSGFTEPLCESFFNKCNEDKELLVFPRYNYFSVYCEGRLFANIEPDKVVYASSCPKNKSLSELLNDVVFCDFKDIVRKGMPQDKERRSQHKIALHARDFVSDMFFCDFECKIPREYLNKEKTPEVDYIAIDLSDVSHPRPVLVEYKRTQYAISKGTAKLEAHYSDFVKINKCPKVKTAIAEAALFSFNKLVDMGKINAKPIRFIDEDGLWFSFLFTDVPVKNFYGYLGKIVTQQNSSNAKHNIPLRVASFASDEDAVICTDAFTDIKQYLRVNYALSSKRNRYPLDI